MTQPPRPAQRSDAGRSESASGAIDDHELTVIQRARRRCLKLRFKDPVQRAADLHLFEDLAWVDERTEAYRAEDAVVRRQVIMELEKRVELLGPGRAAPAWSSLIQGFVATVTIFGTLLLALFNGWFGAVMTMMDTETGVLHGVTSQQISDTVTAFETPIIWALGVLIFLVVATLAGAAAKDRQRGTALAWLHLFSDIDGETTAAAAPLPDAPQASWYRFGPARKRKAAADGDYLIGKLR